MSSALVYSVGSRQHGLGHVMRCLTLADELRERGWDVVFATEHETAGAGVIRNVGYPVSEYHPRDFTWARANVGAGDICILDLENGPERAILEAARIFNHVIVICGSGYVLSDAEAVRELSDLRVYQSIILAEDDPFGLSGVEYMIISPKYTQIRGTFDGPIVISMGGGDPHGLTGEVVAVLIDAPRPVRVIVGPAADKADLPDSVEVIEVANGLHRWLDGASLLIGALGMTAYEAACAGVPSLLTAWSADHERTAMELDKRGISEYLAAWDKFDSLDVMDAIQVILNNESKWQAMSDAGRALVDGHGVERVADGIEQLIAPHETRMLTIKVNDSKKPKKRIARKTKTK